MNLSAILLSYFATRATRTSTLGEWVKFRRAGVQVHEKKNSPDFLAVTLMGWFLFKAGTYRKIACGLMTGGRWKYRRCNWL